MLIPLHDLREATNGFSADSRIGKGGFGDVYKGVYSGREVAVKLLHVDTVHGIDDLQYLNEVGNLLKIKHPNIVQLLGYSYETKSELVEHNGKQGFSKHIYRVLCFEYLQGGNLDEHLHEKYLAPDWSTHYTIIKGTCEGLNFLHGCKPAIFHLDLKPSNILLDNSMMPKVADFGLSRAINQSHTHVTKQMKGTKMYMPPESINGGNISHKNDVFSLGVVMIEIMTGSSEYSSYIEMDKVKQFKQKMRTLTFPTIDPESTKSNMVEMMVAELDNITNKDKHCNSMPRESYENYAQRVPDRETTSDVEESLIIGRTKEKGEILSILSKSITRETIILPIYGIGGIGKTTLAQLVFKDPQFQDYSQVWVHVSETLKLNKIGNSIISQLTEEINQIADKQMLHNRLRKLFTGKSILIVLDDLWEDNIDNLNDLMTMRKLGTRRKVIVLVTTRDEAIAKVICGPAVTPYKLEILTDDMCWTIIKQKSVFKERVDKKQLEHIGMEIATKCGGVALAAHSLGYMLRDMTSDQWESVRDNCIWNLSTRKDPSSRTHKVLASLLLSYSHMPDWLKLCFSYCAVFPKGHNIVNWDLFHQWIALGFTEQSNIFDSIQICEKYVTKLLGMCFLQYSKTQPSSEKHGDKHVTFFTMHDLVHDLAKEVLAHQINTRGNKCRYALLTDCSNSLQLSFPANIKALHFRDCGKQELSADAFSAAKFIRVLDLSECSIKKLPDCIGQLKQLRFLHAPCIQDKIIPDCITELSELNYLNLRGSDNISALPKLIGDMKGLMHLDLSGCYGLHELPISFTELKQLVYLDLSGCNMYTAEAFGGFTKLQYLNLSYAFDHSAGNRKRLPEFIGNLTKLRYLNLSLCMCTQSKEHVGSLLGSISTFSNLEHLDLSWNEELSSIPESIGNLRKLHTLNLSGCYKLKKLPDSMDQMVSLKVLFVENNTKLDECALPRLNFAPLPHFVVHASSDKCSSNISLLQPTNPSKLEIDRLENVKYAEKAHSIKLIEKRQIEELSFKWTVGAERFVEDKEVLEKLVPPSSVQNLHIKGYKSDSFPDWLMHMRRYIPKLCKINLCGCPDFPLGQLPNLQSFLRCYMEGLEEWEWNKACGEGADELMWGRFDNFPLRQHAKLSIKQCQSGAILDMEIVYCDYLLSSWEESSSHSGTSSSSRKIRLDVTGSKVPMHEWRLLHYLPTLCELTIRGCTDLTTSPEIMQRLSSLKSLSLYCEFDQSESPRWLVELTSLQQLKIDHPTLETLNEDTWKLTQLESLVLSCPSMTSLKEWFGELTSLKKFELEYCFEIPSLPDSIQQLTKLETLKIDDCPTLVKWCESEENRMKLAHIRVFDIVNSDGENITKDIFNDSYFSGEDIVDGSDEEDASDEGNIAERVAC